MGNARWEAMGAVLDGLPHAVVSVDLEGTILCANRMAARNLSLTPAEAEGTSLVEHFSESAAMAALQRIRQTVEARATQHFEAVVELPDGRVRSYDSAYCPTLDDDGKVVSVQIVSIDTTTDVPKTRVPDDPWILVSDDLSMTATRVAALLENAPIIVSIYDPDMTIRYMNRLAPGVCMADVIGCTPLAWTAEDSRPVLRGAFAQVIETRSVAECEVMGVSGTHWLVRLAPLVHDGEVEQIMGCTLEITELKRLQAELAQRQKTESLGILARGIAHDFNNLLTAVISYTGLARRRAGSNLEIQPMLDEIDSASRRAADLCEQMLVYSGRNKASNEHAELNGVLAEIAPLTRAGVTAKIELSFELADRPLHTRCGAPQLGQVVVNLINNAADAIGDEGGEITVSTDYVELSGIDEAYMPATPAPGTYVRLRVSDTGAGVSPDSLHLIFDPFYSTKATGHGLGLSVVLGILAAHGGAISVDSAEGRGTTMTLLFPAFDVDVAQAGPGAEAASWPTGNGTVLVVDDVDVVRRSAVLVLAEAGYDIVDVNSGVAALDVLANHTSPIRAVVLDVTMPGIDGYETLSELRRTHPELPVVLSSGRPMELASADPFVHFLPKPYSLDALVRLVTEAVSDE